MAEAEVITHPAVLVSEDAIYLFAFIESSDALECPLPSVTIERRLLLHRVGKIAALVGVVPSTDYCGMDFENHLTDIAWLAPRARRHAELVEWMARWSTVFPVPFGTLFTSLDSLTAFMHAHEATIDTFLCTVANKEEWELRTVAQFDGPEALDELACSAWPEWKVLPKGARYMRLCRDKSALFEFGRTQASAFVRNFIADLRPFASDSRLLAISGSSGPCEAEPLARYALLVEKTNIAAIKGCVQDMASTASRQHIAMTLSGPWPPFSFRPDLK
jgi:hypothetical protein